MYGLPEDIDLGPLLGREMFRSPPAASASLVRLLGSPVVAARRESSGTLVLEFANGEQLDVPDGEEHYESYTLRIGGKL